MAQLDGYISALRNNGQIVNGWSVDSNMYPGQYIMYHVVEDGLIIYEYSNKQPQENLVTVPEEEYEESYSVGARMGYGLLGTAAILGAGLLFLDDVPTGGAGAADNGAAVALASLALTLFEKAILGTGTDSGCDIS